MQIRDFDWVLVCTDQFEETVHFHESVLGLTLRDEGVPMLDSQFTRYATFRLPSGTVLEVVEALEGLKGPVLSLTVDDLAAAEAKMRLEGIEVLSPPVRDDGWGWIYVRSQDGVVYQLQGPVAESGLPPSKS